MDVTAQEIEAVREKYISRLLDPDTSTTIITGSPDRMDEVAKELKA